MPESPVKTGVGQAGFECLDNFQALLHDIYRIDVPYSVSDFVTTDQTLMSALSNGDKDHLKEKLLLHQDGEDLDLSLYLHADVMSSLTEVPLVEHLEESNLQNLCFAIEGISHFIYLIWRVLRQHRVSLLELELQAEVDKYILLSSLIRQQNKHELADRLHHLLFEAVRFDEALSESEDIRYREANRYASKYCHLLKLRYLLEFGCDEMYSELRDFYRMSQMDKLSRISNYPV